MIRFKNGKNNLIEGNYVDTNKTIGIDVDGEDNTVLNNKTTIRGSSGNAQGIKVKGKGNNVSGNEVEIIRDQLNLPYDSEELLNELIEFIVSNKPKNVQELENSQEGSKVKKYLVNCKTPDMI